MIEVLNKPSDIDIFINSVLDLPTANGSREIGVEVLYEQERRFFSGIIPVNADYENAVALEGKDKDLALYKLIEKEIEKDISEFVEEIYEQENLPDSYHDLT